MNHRKPAALLASVLALIIAADPLSAQTAAPPAKEEVLVLSPFVVNSEQDTGYQATSTLAGTRINSDLKDLGASISVITSEFLRDTNATNAESLLTYITGSEVGGPSGNLSSDNLRSSRTRTRLRGLAAATESRDFFRTSIPFDSYNIDRVEINRGSNSILFGTGSPAGIINSSLKQAQMRDTYEVEARYGTFGSFQSSVDFNQQLVKGELAVRVASLYKDQKFEQDLAFQKDQRIYGAFTYDPKWARTRNGVLSGLVLRGNIEVGELDSRRPRTRPPTDAVSGWFAPWFGAFPAKFTWDAGSFLTTTVVDGVRLFTQSPGVQVTEGFFRNPSVLFNTPSSPNPGTGSFTATGAEIVGRQGVTSNRRAVPGGPVGTALQAAAPHLAWSVLRTQVPDSSFYVNPSLIDRSVFDFRNQLLEGPNRFEYANFEAYNIVLEQRFFRDRAGLEVNFNKQDFLEGTSVLAGESSDLRIDINTTLLDGRPNPSFGRPFFVGSWENARSEVDSHVFRATAFCRFDFSDAAQTRWAKWLGKHAFTFLYEDGKSRAKNLSGDRFAAQDYTYGNTQLITDGNGGRLTSLHYVGPSLANVSTTVGANIPGLTAMQLPTASAGGDFLFHGQAAGSQFVVTPLTIIDEGLIPSQNVKSASKTGVDSKAAVVVLQSKMLNDLFVATIGWRRDEVDSFTAKTPLRGPRNNFLVDESDFRLPAKPSLSVADETYSYSYVFHLPRKLIDRVPLVSSLSFRHNTSGNFNPGGARLDSNGRSLPAASGKTKDYGFLLGLADDRVEIGVTWFETSQNGVTAGGGIAGLTAEIVGQYRLFTNITNLGLNPNANLVIAPPQELLDLYSFTVVDGSAFVAGRPDIVLTQDFVSKGIELEANVNLTRNWRLMMNAARQQSVRANTGTAFRELFFERKINGQTLFENWTGPAGQTNFATEGGSTLAIRTQQLIVNRFNSQALQDGGPASELRKWRVNLVTNYTFDRTSRLKGFSLGGGVRWQDRVAIGFPITDSPDGLSRIIDVKNPINGPRELIVDNWIGYQRLIFGDKVNLTVKLNIFNVLNDDELIPVQSQPTGEVAVYRIPSPRRFELSTRFEF